MHVPHHITDRSKALDEATYYAERARRTAEVLGKDAHAPVAIVDRALSAAAWYTAAQSTDEAFREMLSFVAQAGAAAFLVAQDRSATVRIGSRSVTVSGEIPPGLTLEMWFNAVWAAIALRDGAAAHQLARAPSEMVADPAIETEPYAIAMAARGPEPRRTGTHGLLSARRETGPSRDLG